MQNCFEKHLSNAVFCALVVGFLATSGPSVLMAGEVDPYSKPNEAWITISGTVDSVAANSFVLNYGEGAIVVEMDDGDRDADAYKLLKGDKVTVSGEIDADFFESTSIEAATVYVENIGTTFFASSADEEDAAVIAAEITVPFVLSRVTVQGKVKKVNGDDFIIDTGADEIRIDVGSLPYDPLDDEGYQRIDVGDYVKVMGVVDSNLFEGRYIEAQTLIELLGYSS
jgi:uncharacterized protein YdeI (BOF family)